MGLDNPIHLAVAFGYFAVLPAAVRFFQNFNSGQFNVLVQARRHRRFAVAACAAVAALLPGDAITMLLDTAPLYLLFEASVLLPTILERRDRRSTAARPRKHGAAARRDQ
jgi:Sec-independent protein secretion pathway component TatC